MQNLLKNLILHLKELAAPLMVKPQFKASKCKPRKLTKKMQERYQHLKTPGRKSTEINTKMIKLLIQELSKWQ